MRSHLALVVVTALASAACSKALQPPQRACAAPRAPRAAGGIGIIGMSLDHRTASTGAPELFVDRVVPDGPAAAAGIHPGDRILSIEGTSTAGMSIGEAARRLRGPTDASVALRIGTGATTRDVHITRVAPSELWTGAPPTRPNAVQPVRASDVAPATHVAAPPCRQ
jgi:C-terminal processing protease CtpA/Prc